MDVDNPIASKSQLVRLIQMGIVLEEVVEARAGKHVDSLAASDDVNLDPAIQSLLEDAREESAEHRERLEALIGRLGADTVPFDRVERLVEQRYGGLPHGSFDDVLYDQLHGEESAYKFYDDLITAIEGTETPLDVDRDHLLVTLVEIREEEAEGVRRVTELMSEEP